MKPAVISPYGAKSKRASRAEVNAYWERQEQKAPERYRKHIQEQAAMTALLASIPESDAEFDAWYAEHQHKQSYNAHLAMSDDLGLLGIEPGATKRIVKNAYRRAARKLHPDAGGTDEAFKQLHEAYRRVLAAAKE